jgi:hypothetical protein
MVCGAEPCQLQSCDGYCGGMAPGQCYCDELCFNFSDCCSDVCTHCCALSQCGKVCSPPPSCVGHCGGGPTFEGCWCDDGCWQFNDCCWDFCQWCPNCGHCNMANINGDNRVDVFDLLLLLGAWGECPPPNPPHCPTPPPCPADFDESGAVDVFDLLLLLQNWCGGASCAANCQ